MTQIDFEADAVPGVTDIQVKSISDCAARLLKEKAELARWEEWGKSKAALIRSIEETELPELMDAAGMTKFTLTSGEVIDIKPIVAGSIPKSRLIEGLAWLRDNGHAGLIKRKIEVALEKGKDELGDKVIKQLEKLGVKVTSNDTVHPQTLGAWAREMIAEGVQIPLDVLGIYVGRKATVSNPSTKGD